jgi:hypothetical protein
VIARRSACRDLSSDITGRAFSLPKLAQAAAQNTASGDFLRNAPTTCIIIHVTKGTSDDDNNKPLAQ